MKTAHMKRVGAGMHAGIGAGRERMNIDLEKDFSITMYLGDLFLKRV